VGREDAGSGTNRICELGYLTVSPSGYWSRLDMAQLGRSERFFKRFSRRRMVRVILGSSTERYLPNRASYCCTESSMSFMPAPQPLVNRATELLLAESKLLATNGQVNRLFASSRPSACRRDSVTPSIAQVSQCPVERRSPLARLPVSRVPTQPFFVCRP